MNQPLIYQVEPNDDFTVNVYFDDGRVKVFDATSLIDKGGIFAPLSNIDVFKSSCVILNRTLAWDLSGKFDPADCIDVCPDLIYSECLDLVQAKQESALPK